MKADPKMLASLIAHQSYEEISIRVNYRSLQVLSAICGSSARAVIESPIEYAKARLDVGARKQLGEASNWSELASQGGVWARAVKFRPEIG